MFGSDGKFGLIIGCILFIGLAGSPGIAQDNMYVCDLTSSKTGPKPAETEATGSAIFLLDENKQELTYKVTVEKIEDLYMAHLHIGPSDKQGILAAWLYPVEEHNQAERCIDGEFSGILAEGVIRPEDLKEGVTFEELVESFNKDNAYVNVHTKKFVMGAIRGQSRTGDYAGYMNKMPPAAGRNK